MSLHNILIWQKFLYTNTYTRVILCMCKSDSIWIVCISFVVSCHFVALQEPPTEVLNRTEHNGHTKCPCRHNLTNSNQHTYIHTYTSITICLCVCCKCEQEQLAYVNPLLWKFHLLKIQASTRRPLVSHT